MSYIITIDKATDKEISRKEKGRGRGPKDAIKKDDGNYYIYGTQETLEKQEEPLKEHTDTPLTADEEKIAAEEKDDKEHAQSESLRKKGRLVIGNVVRFETLMKSLHYSPKDITITEDEVSIFSVMIASKIDKMEKLIDFNSIYSKMVIDKKNNIVKIWILPTTSPASRVKNLKEEMKNKNEDFTEEMRIKEFEKGFTYDEPADKEILGCLIREE